MGTPESLALLESEEVEAVDLRDVVAAGQTVRFTTRTGTRIYAEPSKVNGSPLLRRGLDSLPMFTLFVEPPESSSKEAAYPFGEKPAQFRQLVAEEGVTLDRSMVLDPSVVSIDDRLVAHTPVPQSPRNTAPTDISVGPIETIELLTAVA